jgi:cbb3-type cytochrome oxidase subunit 1
MKQLYYATTLYTVLGLVAGFFYREFTKAHNFTGKTELAVTHTHLLALGTLFFLIVLALEKQFALSSQRLFGWFFWTYNVGVLWTVAIMTAIGMRTVLGRSESDLLAHLAGGGHILLTVGLTLFFVCLYRPVTARREVPVQV